MLIQFTVENFLSFKEKALFSLLATSDEAHPSHLVLDAAGKNKNVLRAAAIYGANGSGKSNFVQAMKFARELILEGTQADEAIAVTPYKLNSTSDQPSRFQFIFSYRGIEYSYGFKLNASQILEEFLYATPHGKEVRYFERVTSDKLETEVEFGASLTKGNRGKLPFLKYKEADTRPNQLFLTTVFEGNMKDRVEELIPVMRWFRSVLTIIEAESRYRDLESRTHSTTALKDFLGNFLRASDTGIEAVTTSEVPLDWDRDLPWVPSKMREDILQRFKKRNSEEGDNSAEGVVEVVGPFSTRVYLRQNEEDQLVLVKLLLTHRGEDGKSIDFQMNEESEGTQRVIHLAPMLFDLSAGRERVIVLDELDRRLHPHLSRLILLTALECQDKNQLLFTTHDTNLLDLNLLRRDEIWFVEKDKAGRSHLFSLAEFKVRPDLQIEKGYLNGRFGAIPFIGDIHRLDWNDQASQEAMESIHA